ncbi:MAG: transketolase, partial [Oscillospiraceae bacterium]|nr:transketolase [Oscillospiraceae bacterium]
MDIKELKEVCRQVRRDIIIEVADAASGHPGGSLSAVEMLVALYFKVMNIDPKEPQKADRDRFVLSKGHAAPGLYAVLAERGYFDKEELHTLRKLGSKLQGH